MPGLLRARHRQQPGRPHLCGHARRRRLVRERAEGLDEPGAVRAAVRAAHPHGRTRLCPPGHHGAVRRHGHARHHRATHHDDPRTRGVLRGLLRRRARARRSDAGRRGAGLGRGDGPAALRAQHRSLAPRRLPAPHARGAPASRRRRGPSGPTRSARPSSSSSRSAPDPARPSTGWRPATARSRDVDRQDPPRDHRAVDLRPRPRRPGRGRSCSATTPPASSGDRSTSTRRAATIYGGSAEIQRNIVARRLLDLGAER